MAVVTVYSDLRTLERAQRLTSGAKNSMIKHATGTCGSIGDATSLIELFTLRANEVLYPDAMWLSHSAFEANATIDVGYASYTLPDGTVVAADPDGIATGLDGDAIKTGESLSATKVVTAFTAPVNVVITLSSMTAGYVANDTYSVLAIVGQHHS